MFGFLLIVLIVSSLTKSFGSEYIVGDSFWSIPTTTDFYNNWSSSHFFQIGDTLYFEFDSGLHNVMQVSGREYGVCTAEHPYEVFWDGPARIVLMEEGHFYFICSIANYCALGQKLSVVIHRQNNSPPDSSQNLSPPPGNPHSDSDPLSSSSSNSELAPPPMPPRFFSPASNNGKTNCSMSRAPGSRSGGDQCHGGMNPGWFAAFYIAFYVFLG